MGPVTSLFHKTTCLMEVFEQEAEGEGEEDLPGFLYTNSSVDHCVDRRERKQPKGMTMGIKHNYIKKQTTSQ